MNNKIDDIIKTFGNELAMHLTPSNESMKAVRFAREALTETLHQQLQKALTCGKDMGDGSICGCKLDCHLHDWRQREEIQKAREEAVDELLTDIDFSYLLKEQERGEFGHVTSELERLAFKYRI